jgi:ABC-2 type transport system permease protein
MTAPVPAGAGYPTPPAHPFASPQAQPPAPRPAPPGAAFSSPIPVTPARFGHALRSEWTKIRTVRSTLWTLGVMLVLVIGVDLLVVTALRNHRDASMPVLAPGLFGLLLGQIAVLTLGALVITSEYGNGMIRTTFTACPSRSRVLAAKAVVFFAVSFATTTLACALTAVIADAVIAGYQVGPDGYHDPGVVVHNGVTAASGGEWLGATVGVGLYVALLGLLALSVGALLRHSAGAITTMLGVVLLPLIVALFLPGSLDSTRRALIRYSAPNGLASLYHVPMIGDGSQNGVHQLVTLVVVTAVALAAAFTVLNTRDV